MNENDEENAVSSIPITTKRDLLPSSDSEDDEDTEKALKMVLLGDICCGKTALCLKIAQHIFQPKYTALWDVGGHNIGSPAMLSTYVHGAHAVLFVYDVTNTQSFENIFDWIAIVKKIARQMEKPFSMYLVGSKTDLEHRRVVSVDKNNKAAEQYGLDPFYVSAKTGDNVELMFKTISAKILGVRMSRAEQEWNISVVQAPISSDNGHAGPRPLYPQLYYKNIGGVPPYGHATPDDPTAAANSQPSSHKNSNAGVEGRGDVKSSNLQLKPFAHNRNSAVCCIS